jgi:hypothetical protein
MEPPSGLGVAGDEPTARLRRDHSPSTGNAQPNGTFQGNAKLQISNVPVSLRQAVVPWFSVKFSWTGEVLQAIP